MYYLLKVYFNVNIEDFFKNKNSKVIFDIQINNQTLK